MNERHIGKFLNYRYPEYIKTNSLFRTTAYLMIGCLFYLGCDNRVSQTKEMSDQSTPKEVWGGSEVSQEEHESYNNAIAGLAGKLGTGLLVAPRLVLTAEHCGRPADETTIKDSVQFDYFDSEGVKHTQNRTKIDELDWERYFPGGPDIGLWLLESPPSVALPYWNYVQEANFNIEDAVLESYGYGASLTSQTGREEGPIDLTYHQMERVFDYTDKNGNVHTSLYDNKTTYIKMTGNNGDADLYVKVGGWPTLTDWDCRPYTGYKTNYWEYCEIQSEGWQRIYVMVRAYSGNPTVSVEVDYQNEYYGEHGPLRKRFDCSISSEVYKGAQEDDYYFDYICSEPNSDVTSESGDSGGPVFDQFGQLIGVHSGFVPPLRRTGIATFLPKQNNNNEPLYIDWINSMIDEYLAVLRTGDIDGDGRDDLVYWTPNGNGIWFDTSSNQLPDGTADGNTHQWCSGELLFANVYGGSMEIPFCHEGDENRLSAGWTPTGGEFGDDVISLSGACEGEVKVGDFNGDGLPDLFCRSLTHGWRSIDFHSGQFTPLAAIYSGKDWEENSHWCGQELLVGDFNGDGSDDLLCWNKGDRMWLRYFNPQTQSFGSHIFTYTQYCSDAQGVIQVADFNADGVSDLLCNNPDSKIAQVDFADTSVYFPFSGSDMSSDYSGWCAHSLGHGDLNGDGFEDFTCYDGRTGIVTADFNDGGAFDTHIDLQLPY